MAQKPTSLKSFLLSKKKKATNSQPQGFLEEKDGLDFDEDLDNDDFGDFRTVPKCDSIISLSSDEDSRKENNCNLSKQISVQIIRDSSPEPESPKKDDFGFPDDDDFSFSESNSVTAMDNNKKTKLVNGMSNSGFSKEKQEEESYETPKRSAPVKRCKKPMIFDSDSESPKKSSDVCNLLSDSENDSPIKQYPAGSSSNEKSSFAVPVSSPLHRSPKKWQGPDFKVSLKPLGIDKNLNTWIQSTKEKPVMSSIPTKIDKLEERKEDLRNLQVQILEKYVHAMHQIPISVLEKMPQFDAETFSNLKVLYHHVKAKMRRIEKTLVSEMEKQKSKVFESEDEDDFVSTPPSSRIEQRKSTTLKSKSLSKHQSTPSVSLKSSKSAQNYFIDSELSEPSDSPNKNFGQSSKQGHVPSVAEPDTTNFQEDASMFEVSDNCDRSQASTKSDCSTVSKKSTFQLKIPVKATIPLEQSKKLGELWEKSNFMSSAPSPINFAAEMNKSGKSSDASFNKLLDDVSTDEKKVENNSSNSIISVPSSNNSMTSLMSELSFSNFQDDFDVPSGSNYNISRSLTQELTELPELDSSWTVPSTSLEKSIFTPSKTKNQENIYHVGKFIGDFKNDGVSGEFDSMHYEHSKEMMRIFRQKFGLYNFRPNQMQAINAILLGLDCFILMPTGGGKSLCYQLPAVLVPGVTIVVSPLKSLILDQVQKLISLDIPAAQLSGSITEKQSDAVYRELSKIEPNLKLLYVTPEKIASSQKFTDRLRALYERNLVARFVIDEAHCVSQWGHDFRPDYKKLKCLRDNYPKAPVIALTATATPRVRLDILHQLGMSNPKWFMSSFNRPNLRYSVLAKKGKNCGLEVAAMIKSKYNNQCGIVYCFSRKDCEDYATNLRSNGIKAQSYHAGLTDNQRNDVQDRWVTDKVKVICATIAFGMGIDKPNVRFVIHASLPKSIEGYYQESGRAGRDGEIADCILFYNYGDMHRIRKMLEGDKSSMDAYRTHMDNLTKIVAFCENKTDCRRTLQLNYFGEIFEKEQCIANKPTTCDNCRNKGQFNIIDLTADVKKILKDVRDIDQKRGARLTTNLLVDIYKGSDLKKLRDTGLNSCPIYGNGKSWQKNDIERLMHKLVIDGYLQETMYIQNEIACAYVKIGPKAAELMNSKNAKVEFFMRSSTEISSAAAAVATVDKPNENIFKELQDNCYTELMTYVQAIAATLDCSTSSIMNILAIRLMSQQLPENEIEMLQIPHVTKANFEKYGKDLLEITQQYAAEKLMLIHDTKTTEPAVIDDDFEDTWSDSANSFTSTTSRKRKGNSSWRGKTKRFKRGASNRASTSRARKSTVTSSRGRGSPRGRGRGTSTGPGLVQITQSKKFLSDPYRFVPVNK